MDEQEYEFYMGLTEIKQMGEHLDYIHRLPKWHPTRQEWAEMLWERRHIDPCEAHYGRNY